MGMDWRMTLLALYLAQHRIRQIDFAARLNVAQGTVSRLVNGSTNLSLELAVKIERETGGAVPATSWIPETEAANDSADPEHERGAA